MCKRLLVIDSTLKWPFNFAACRAVTLSFVTFCDCRLLVCSAFCKIDGCAGGGFHFLMQYARCVTCSAPKEPEELFATVFSQPQGEGCVKTERKSVAMRCNR